MPSAATITTQWPKSADPQSTVNGMGATWGKPANQPVSRIIQFALDIVQFYFLCSVELFATCSRKNIVYIFIFQARGNSRDCKSGN